MVPRCDSCRYPSWIGNGVDVGSTRSAGGLLSLGGFRQLSQDRLGDGKLKDGAAGTRLLQRDVAAVFLCDFLRKGKAQAGAARLAHADKRLKQRFTYGLGNAR